MAEINLGRIKFIWKGKCAAATLYNKEDNVRKGAALNSIQIAEAIINQT